MKPLSHLTVADLTVNLPGPFCSMTLGDLGARVIKVEPPDGDPLRHSPGMWAALNRGKESIALDLKTDAGRELLGKLAATADVVLEGWRPGVAKRLGADRATLSADNPGLVYCSISGFGQEGPWRERAGHDINYLALSGYMDVQASIEGRPWPPAILVSDLAAGMYAAIAVLAAVCSRQAGGEGAYIDLSMEEAVVSLLGPELGRLATDGKGAPNVSAIPHYGLFACADGRWLSLGIVHEDHFWDRFCDVAGLNELAGVPFAERLDRASEVERAVADVVITRAADEWERVLVAADVPAAAVVELSDVFESAQLASRGVFPSVGARRFVAFPALFSGARAGPTDGPPGLGQHMPALLAEYGYDRRGVSELRQAGAFGKSQVEVIS